MATILVFDPKGVREIKCFDTLMDVPYIEEDEDEISDDGELTVGLPIE